MSPCFSMLLCYDTGCTSKLCPGTAHQSCLHHHQPQQVRQQLYMSARRGSSLRALQLHLPDGVLLPAGFLHHQLVHYSSTFNRGSFPKRMSSTPDGRVLFNPRGSDIQVSTGLSHRGAWLLRVAQCSA